MAAATLEKAAQRETSWKMEADDGHRMDGRPASPMHVSICRHVLRLLAFGG